MWTSIWSGGVEKGSVWWFPDIKASGQVLLPDPGSIEEEVRVFVQERDRVSLRSVVVEWVFTATRNTSSASPWGVPSLNSSLCFNISAFSIEHFRCKVRPGAWAIIIIFFQAAAILNSWHCFSSPLITRDSDHLANVLSVKGLSWGMRSGGNILWVLEQGVLIVLGDMAEPTYSVQGD